jgi:hypothetical protein
VAVIAGLFFAGLAYLQYQQIVNINWNKLQLVSQNAVTTLANATTQIPGFNNGDHVAALSRWWMPSGSLVPADILSVKASLDLYIVVNCVSPDSYLDFLNFLVK